MLDDRERFLQIRPRYAALSIRRDHLQRAAHAAVVLLQLRVDLSEHRTDTLGQRARRGLGVLFRLQVLFHQRAKLVALLEHAGL